jgi:hypothetical protein
VSLVLLTRSQEYVEGLTAYRYQRSADSPEAAAGMSQWFDMFLQAVGVAVEQARLFVDQLGELQQSWAERYTAHRTAAGSVRRARADSAVMRLLPLLPEVPVTTAQRMLDLSAPAARAALGILSRQKVHRGTTAYLAREVFDLLTTTERRLASTRWDTREAAPWRPSTARPQAR